MRIAIATITLFLILIVHAESKDFLTVFNNMADPKEKSIMERLLREVATGQQTRACTDKVEDICEGIADDRYGGNMYRFCDDKFYSDLCCGSCLPFT